MTLSNCVICISILILLLVFVFVYSYSHSYLQKKPDGSLLGRRKSRSKEERVEETHDFTGWIAVTGEISEKVEEDDEEAEVYTRKSCDR